MELNFKKFGYKFEFICLHKTYDIFADMLGSFNT